MNKSDNYVPNIRTQPVNQTPSVPRGHTATPSTGGLRGRSITRGGKQQVRSPNPAIINSNHVPKQGNDLDKLAKIEDPSKPIASRKLLALEFLPTARQKNFQCRLNDAQLVSLLHVYNTLLSGDAEAIALCQVVMKTILKRLPSNNLSIADYTSLLNTLGMMTGKPNALSYIRGHLFASVVDELWARQQFEPSSLVPLSVAILACYKNGIFQAIEDPLTRVNFRTNRRTAIKLLEQLADQAMQTQALDLVSAPDIAELIHGYALLNIRGQKVLALVHETKTHLVKRLKSPCHDSVVKALYALAILDCLDTHTLEALTGFTLPRKDSQLNDLWEVFAYCEHSEELHHAWPPIYQHFFKSHQEKNAIPLHPCIPDCYRDVHYILKEMQPTVLSNCRVGPYQIHFGCQEERVAIDLIHPNQPFLPGAHHLRRRFLASAGYRIMQVSSSKWTEAPDDETKTLLLQRLFKHLSQPFPSACPLLDPREGLDQSNISIEEIFSLNEDITDNIACLDVLLDVDLEMAIEHFSMIVNQDHPSDHPSLITAWRQCYQAVLNQPSSEQAALLVSLFSIGMEILEQTASDTSESILEDLLPLFDRLVSSHNAFIISQDFVSVKDRLHSALLNHMRQTDPFGEPQSFFKRLRLTKGHILPADSLKVMLEQASESMIPDWLLTYFMEHPAAPSNHERIHRLCTSSLNQKAQRIETASTVALCSPKTVNKFYADHPQDIIDLALVSLKPQIDSPTYHETDFATLFAHWNTLLASIKVDSPLWLEIAKMGLLALEKTTNLEASSLLQKQFIFIAEKILSFKSNDLDRVQVATTMLLTTLNQPHPKQATVSRCRGLLVSKCIPVLVTSNDFADWLRAEEILRLAQQQGWVKGKEQVGLTQSLLQLVSSWIESNDPQYALGLLRSQRKHFTTPQLQSTAAVYLFQCAQLFFETNDNTRVLLALKAMKVIPKDSVPTMEKLWTRCLQTLDDPNLAHLLGKRSDKLTKHFNIIPVLQERTHGIIPEVLERNTKEYLTLALTLLKITDERDAGLWTQWWDAAAKSKDLSIRLQAWQVMRSFKSGSKNDPISAPFDLLGTPEQRDRCLASAIQSLHACAPSDLKGLLSDKLKSKDRKSETLTIASALEAISDVDMKVTCAIFLLHRTLDLPMNAKTRKGNLQSATAIYAHIPIRSAIHSVKIEDKLIFAVELETKLVAAYLSLGTSEGLQAAYKVASNIVTKFPEQYTPEKLKRCIDTLKPLLQNGANIDKDTQPLVLKFLEELERSSVPASSLLRLASKLTDSPKEAVSIRGGDLCRLGIRKTKGQLPPDTVEKVSRSINKLLTSSEQKKVVLGMECIADALSRESSNTIWCLPIVHPVLYRLFSLAEFADSIEKRSEAFLDLLATLSPLVSTQFLHIATDIVSLPKVFVDLVIARADKGLPVEPMIGPYRQTFAFPLDQLQKLNPINETLLQQSLQLLKVLTIRLDKGNKQNPLLAKLSEETLKSLIPLPNQLLDDHNEIIGDNVQATIGTFLDSPPYPDSDVNLDHLLELVNDWEEYINSNQVDILHSLQNVSPDLNALETYITESCEAGDIQESTAFFQGLLAHLWRAELLEDVKKLFSIYFNHLEEHAGPEDAVTIMQIRTALESNTCANQSNTPAHDSTLISLCTRFMGVLITILNRHPDSAPLLKEASLMLLSSVNSQKGMLVGPSTWFVMQDCIIKNAPQCCTTRAILPIVANFVESLGRYHQQIDNNAASQSVLHALSRMSHGLTHSMGSYHQLAYTVCYERSTQFPWEPMFDKELDIIKNRLWQHEVDSITTSRALGSISSIRRQKTLLGSRLRWVVDAYEYDILSPDNTTHNNWYNKWFTAVNLVMEALITGNDQIAYTSSLKLFMGYIQRHLCTALTLAPSTAVQKNMAQRYLSLLRQWENSAKDHPLTRVKCSEATVTWTNIMKNNRWT